MAFTGVTDQEGIWSLFNVAWDFAQEGFVPTLERVLNQVAGWFQASGASLLLRQDNDDAVYKMVCAVGLDAKTAQHVEVKPGEGIAGACIELGHPMLIHDPVKHPGLSKRKPSVKRPIESAMVVPLQTPVSGCIGVLCVSRGTGASKFQESDLAAADSVARFIALAVENLRLFTRATQATQEARATHAKLQEIIQCLGVAVLVVEQSERLTEANPEALKLLYSEGVDSILVKGIWRGIRKALQGETVRTRVYNEEEDRSWSLVCTPIKGGGATATIEEVTEQERNVREMNRMGRLAEIGQMSALIAHEIRNPLTGIRSAAQLVRSAPSEAVELSQIIEEETLKLNALCDDFLDFSRPLALRISDVKFDELARLLERQHRDQFMQAKVALKVKIEPNLPTISGDSLRLEQVMRNLLLNGLQACSAGGKVVLSVTPDGFRVEDDGCGMSPETIERLFVPFSRPSPRGRDLA